MYRPLKLQLYRMFLSLGKHYVALMLLKPKVHLLSAELFMYDFNLVWIVFFVLQI